jgi:4-alpha-glucanotransferase
VIAVNPLHAALPVEPQEPSPYSPSTRRWTNPLYLRVEEVPGAAENPAIDELAAAGRALNQSARIDRDAVYRLKLDGLARLWRRFPGSSEFDAFRTRHGDDLAGYATFCALAEHHRSGWSSWPAEYQRPDAPAVARFAAEHADRVRFHSWLQWLLDGQLDRAGAGDLMIADVAVGFAPDGADAWAWQDTLALDMRIGAPPDQFNTQGQGWGLPPFIPWRLRSAGYEPFIRTIRAALRRAQGIRIDHVMGLFRLFWIPVEAGPRDGTYVRFDGRELLDIVALESTRAAAFVVGEDLGTVEGDVRSRLAAAGMLSYRLLWFEPGDPEEYPRQALAAVSTHDLPTVAGLWTGTDLAAQRALGLEPNERGTVEMREHLASLTGATDDTPVDEVVVRAYRRLADAPSMVVTASLDDALAVPDRPNMPGTVDEWPNWSIPLPLPIDDLAGHEVAGRVLDAVARHGPVRSPPP